MAIAVKKIGEIISKHFDKGNNDKLSSILLQLFIPEEIKKGKVNMFVSEGA